MALLFVAAVVAIAYFALWPGSLDPPKNAGFGDNVFASSPVVFAARLFVLSAGVVLAVGGVFVVQSIIKLWSAQRWFTRFGPFEASPEAIGELADQVEFWRDSAIEQGRQVQELREQLEQADELLGELLADARQNEGDA